MAYYASIITILGSLAIVAVLLALGLLGSLATNGGRRRFSGLRGLEIHPLGWAWGVATIATLGSLYLSEVAHLVPCSLCWYQRFAMYPLVLILGFGLVRGATAVWRVGLPLAALGLVISVYHVTIQWQPTLDVGACTSGAPCTGRYLAVFGFISIPTMAGAAFLLIISLLLLVRMLERTGDADPEVES